MKLLSVNLARSLWFCHVADFNPKGLNVYPIIIPILVSSYKFKKYPSENEVIDETKGVTFENGEFTNDEDITVNVNMTIYSDGLVVDTRSSTKDSDDFLVDILTRFHEELNMPIYDDVIKRRSYLSQLFISTHKSLELINPRLKEISNYLSENVLAGMIPYETGGIHFWPDQTNVIKTSPFIFERTLNVPFSENRYFSAAPLKTDQHLELLIMLENILSE